MSTLLIFLTGASAHAATSINDVKACFNSLVDATSASGISAAIAVDNDVVLRKGFGKVKPGSTRSVKPNTRFRVGSTNKAMTATAVMSLVDDGLLSLNDRVVNIFPAFDVDAEQGWINSLKIKSLLTHQGALYDSVVMDGPRNDADLSASWADPQFQQSYPMMAKPNSFFNYSNGNFSLAGLMAETQDGNYYRQLMENRVFQPLGMNRTVFLPEQVMQDQNYAFGVSGSDVLDADAYDNAVLRPSGWVWSTADDLLAFARFIKDGNTNVLKNKSWKAIRGKKVNTQNLLDRIYYGYGVYVQDYYATASDFYDQVTTMEHGGNVVGYTAKFITLPDQGFAMSVIGNTDNLDFSPCIDMAVLATVESRLPNPGPFPDVEIDPATFGDYAGNYYERIGNFGGDFSMATDNAGNLVINFPVLDSLGIPYDPILQPVSRDNFVLVLQGQFYQVTGIRNKNSGEIEYLRNRYFVGKKLN